MEGVERSADGARYTAGASRTMTQLGRKRPPGRAVPTPSRLSRMAVRTLLSRRYRKICGHGYRALPGGCRAAEGPWLAPTGPGGCCQPRGYPAALQWRLPDQWAHLAARAALAHGRFRLVARRARAHPAPRFRRHDARAMARA